MASLQGTHFKVKLHLLEDLHSGTGTGEAQIDAVQACDRRGRPVLRATHVKGVWREAARALANLASADYGATDSKLFGDKKSGQRGQVLLNSFYMASEGQTDRLIWTSASRQGMNRAPSEDMLRNIEHVGASTIFEAEVRLRDATLAKTWQDCLAHTPALGGRRSRNARNVYWEITPQNAPRSVNLEPPETETALQLRLLLRNLDPLCLPQTGNPTNVIRSEGYIRGQRLFGAFAQWALDNKKPADWSQLFEEEIQFGNAYPLPCEVGQLKKPQLAQCQVLPVAMNLGAKKPVPAGDGSWPWWAGASAKDHLGDLEEEDRFVAKDPDLKRPKGYEFLYQPAAGKRWRRYRTLLGVHMRNQSRRRSSDKGELFSEEEIAEQTCFLADLRFPDQPSAVAFAETYAPVLWCGEWLTVGRGGRPVEVLQAVWMNKAGAQSEAKTDDFTLTLESDLIARADRPSAGRLPILGFFDDLDPGVLLMLLGEEDEAIGWQALHWEGFCETRLVYGYNAASGLQRAPVLAIERGSSIRIWGQGASGLRAKLAAKIPDGLGEGTRAGYGRFRFDFAPLTDQGEGTSPAGGAVTPAQHASPGLGVGESLLAEAEDIAKRITNGPGRAQWQDFRHRVRAANTWEQIKGVFTEFHTRSGQHGGKDWAELPQGVQLGDLQVKAKSIHDENDIEACRLFLEAIARYRLLALDEATTREQNHG
jgi:hypothetical protein